MAELCPSDAELNALSGTNDPEQEVHYVTTGEAPYYTSFYKFVHRLLLAARRAGDLRVYKDAALTFGVRAGKYFDGDTLVEYAGASAQALTNNQTNYIYLTAAGVLTVNITGFPVPSVTPHIRLATILTAAGDYAISDITDHRGTAFLAVARGPADLTGLDWQESVIDELNLVTSEPASPTLGDRYLNTATGSSSETSQSVTDDYIYQWNGTSWTEIVPDEGAVCLVEDRDMLVGYNGSAWVDVGTFALLDEAQTFFAASDISGAEAETLTDGSNADSLHVHAAAGLASAVQDLVPTLSLSGTDDGDGTGSMDIQAKDAAGNNLAERVLARVWIADAAYSEPDPQTGFSVATGEQMRQIEANADYEVISDATGLITMDIDAGGAKTVHVMAEIDGRIWTASVAITTP